MKIRLLIVPEPSFWATSSNSLGLTASSFCRSSSVSAYPFTAFSRSANRLSRKALLTRARPSSSRSAF